MRRKGFTLIELLAVIVILAVIALIAVPMIMNVIEKARKSSFLSSAYGILESAENYYISSFFDNEQVHYTFVFPEDKLLSFKGEKPKNGYVQINDKGRIELQLYNGTWCAYKGYYADTIHLEDGPCQNFKGSITIDEVEATYFRGEMIDVLEGVVSYNNENQPTENNIGYYGTLDRKSPGEYHITYYLKDDTNVRAEKIFYILEDRYHADFDYTGDVQKFEAPYEGVYEVELWGASGGNPAEENGYGAGAYTKGSIHLKKGDILYVYVGAKGNNTRNIAFNGGGYGGYGKISGYSGGGATDIRLVDGAWNDVEGLRSRIMVSAGGGGVAAGSYNSAGEKSYAGGLTGFSGGYYSGHPFVNQNGKGGTQISGGAKGNNHSNATGTAYSGSFGIGGNNDTSSSSEGAGGGGGGYYGGGAGGGTQYGGAGQGGGGGSSFISGYVGCNAIDKEGNPTGQPNHYSGLIFQGSQMLSGREEMPNPRGEEPMIGNSNNGFARITLLHDIEEQPMLYLFGENHIIQQGENFEEPGYTTILGILPDNNNYHVSVQEVDEKIPWVMYQIIYSLYDQNNQLIDSKTREILYTIPFLYNYTGDAQKFEAPYEGVYEVELWGASGGNPAEENGYGAGAYTKGSIHLKKGDILYVYVGEKGNNTRNIAFNGGGYGGYGSTIGLGYSGGGATDVRLVNGEWNGAEGLKSRIMVAAGGGGVAAGSYNSAGEKSYAGGLTGFSGGYYSGHPFVNQNGKGGTQISGGAKGNNHSNATGTAYSGIFGIGGNNDTSSSSLGAGGGGGGYYGGGAGGGTQYGGAGQGGGGGSSFISGYVGCNAIDKEGNPTGQPNHYSGLIFQDSQMLSGREEMPNPRGEEPMIGNSNNGFARIQLISY